MFRRGADKSVDPSVDSFPNNNEREAWIVILRQHLFRFLLHLLLCGRNLSLTRVDAIQPRPPESQRRKAWIVILRRHRFQFLLHLLLGGRSPSLTRVNAMQPRLPESRRRGGCPWVVTPTPDPSFFLFLCVQVSNWDLETQRQ